VLRPIRRTPNPTTPATSSQAEAIVRTTQRESRTTGSLVGCGPGLRPLVFLLPFFAERPVVPAPEPRLPLPEADLGRPDPPRPDPPRLELPRLAPLRPDPLRDALVLDLGRGLLPEPPDPPLPEARLPEPPAFFLGETLVGRITSADVSL
jgi:hypothetical protein